MKSFSSYHFSFFRILLGLYIAFHFIHLIPYGAELFSTQGVLPEADLNFTYGIFPNILNHWDAPIFVQLFLVVMVLLALLFSLGIKRRIIALLLWYGWAALFNRNVLISNPGLPFIGWLLLACALIPKGEPLSLERQKDSSWQMPRELFFGAWLIMSLGYTISGIHKLGSPSWIDGTAIIHVFNNPLARDYFLREWVLALPEQILHLITWGSLALETLFAPLALFRKTRPYVWSAIICMHLGILSLVSFADLTIGVLMIHVFTFDSRWLKPKYKTNESLVLYFDGVCGLCNKTVDFVFQEDRSSHMKFSPLQSVVARQELPKRYVENLNSLVIKNGGLVLDGSDAVLMICSYLGGHWRLFSIFKILPKALRDKLYNFVSKNRYSWFGINKDCRLPSDNERSRFLN